MIIMPSLTEDQLQWLEDWEQSIVRSFLDHHNRIIPYYQARLTFSQQFVYGNLLNRLYRDNRFSVPLTHLQDPFIYPFQYYVDNPENWREFKSRLIPDPLDLLLLIEKLLNLVYFNSETLTLR